MAESLYTGSETSIPIGDAGGDHNSLVDDDHSAPLKIYFQLILCLSHAEVYVILQELQ